MKTGLIHLIPRSSSLALVPRPRPRSNSASLHSNALLPFLDSPPPPPARLHPPPRETKHLNQLALTPSTPESPNVILPITVPYPARPLYDVYWATLPLHPPTKSTPTHYTLDVGAYGIPKHHPHHAFSTHTSIHSDPTHLAVQVGEDAYFVRGNALGVADGVGGWAKRSPSPTPTPDPSPSALFAKRLMHYTAAELDPRDQLEQHLAELQEGIDVLGILETAYTHTVKAHVNHAGEPIREGSSTALVAVLQDADGLDPYVSVAQVGDCVGMVVREDQVVWRTQDMWWAWNTPVQLAPPPRPHPAPSTRYMPFHPPPPPPSTSKPNDVLITPRTAAQISTVPVRKDDILILASDGLSDNLWDEDVLDEVRRFRGTWARHGDGDMAMKRAAMAGMLSEALCSRARRASERKGKPPEETLTDADADTPFARRAREAGKVFQGGKRDDISVLVAIVAQASPTHTS